jgi:glycosyltransferase involved in cell wall biosynthesis
MKILLLHQQFLEENDAGGSRWNEMTRIWSELNHDITVVSGMMHYNGFEKRPEYKGKYFVKKTVGSITVWRTHVSEAYNSSFLGRLWGYFSFVFSSMYCLFVKINDKPDVLIVTSPPLFLSITAILYAKIKRVPMIFEVRDLWPESAIDTGVVTNKLVIRLAYWLEKKSYQSATKINVLTPAFKDALINRKNISPEKIIYIPNAADFSISDDLLQKELSLTFREKYNLQDKFIITYVGAHGVANNLNQVLDTAILLEKNNVVFVLIGNGMEKPQLVKRAENENIKNVIFIDSVPKVDVFKFILESDMGASVLKKVDTFKTVYSNKTFDYFACKKPVFMLIDGVSRALVEEAKAGSYVEPENPEAFAAKIVEYQKDFKRIEIEGQNGYNFAKKNFDRSSLALQYLDHIKEVIKAK